MKQYITMLPVQSGAYRFLEPMNSKIGALVQIFTGDFCPGELVNWLYDEKQTSTSNEWVSIRKQRGVVALYDVSAWMDETYDGEYLDPEKRFEMTVKNFAETLVQWEELRVSRPDIILIVIHEDNHVSLEADSVIIKQYQDAGYAFDMDKK